MESFATIQPAIVHFKGKPGETLRETVRIVPAPDRPFAIREAKAWKGEFITFKLDKNPRDNSYRLTVENKKNEPGGYLDRIYLITDSAIKPTIMIKVLGKIL